VVGGDLFARKGGLGFGHWQISQIHLLRIGLKQTLLALLTKNLPTKPLELVFQRLDFALHRLKLAA